MPSSTSSSDAAVVAIPLVDTRAAPRLTASDRPGVAQPVPERDIPVQPWRSIFVGALGLFVVLMAGWEFYWRTQGAMPGYHNSNGEWAQQRRRIDSGEGGKTVLVGSSRMLFDVQLPVWEKVTGERPIQLAIEGTSAVPVLEDLAADPNFTGRALVRRGLRSVLHRVRVPRRRDSLLSQRKPVATRRQLAVARIHRTLFRVRRFRFRARRGAQTAVLAGAARAFRTVSTLRKLLVQDADRNSHLWSKLVRMPNTATWRARSGRSISTGRRRRRWTRPKNCRKSSTRKFSAPSMR